MLWKIAVVALCITSPLAAWANSASYNGAAGALMPVSERRVTMLSENISFHQGDRLRWRVVARYRFVNRSSELVKIDLGFPLIARISEGPRYDRSNPFRYSFKVRVERRRVPLYWRYPSQQRWMGGCLLRVELIPAS